MPDHSLPINVPHMLCLRPSSGLATLKCFVFGVMYLGVSQVCCDFWPCVLLMAWRSVVGLCFFSPA